MQFTRRRMIGSLGSLAAAAKAAMAQGRANLQMWRPKLGVLAQFSESNVEFARQEGFTSIGFWADPKAALDPAAVNDALVEKVRSTVRQSGLHLSVIGAGGNHVHFDPDARRQTNAYFGKVIELAGRLGVPYIGTQSGTLPGRPLREQVDEIVRVYNEKYFPLCQQHHVRILWEPWPGGPNIATGPVGFEALLSAFGNSPYVGLQYDPSHLLWQMMDPIQCARDFIDKIYDVHLKDTEIRWEVLRRTGIHPLNNERWWRYRIPGMGSIDWPAFFTVLMSAGYSGAMNIEHEDDLYLPAYQGHDFNEGYKTGFRVGHAYLRQYVPV